MSGYQNNNPGNIEDGPFARGLPGYAGTDGRFAQFDTVDNGFGAMERLLTTKPYQKLGSISGALGRWAPAGDAGNDPAAYVSYVSNATGIHPDDTTALADPAARKAIIRAMAEYENGTRGPNPMRRAFAPQGQAAMADQLTQEVPALSPTGVSGALGGLFGGNFNDRSDRALLWLKSISHPELAAAAAAPKDDYSLVPTPDGGMMMFDKKKGTFKQVMAPTPKPEKIGTGPMGDIMGIRVGRKYVDPTSGQVIFDLDNPEASGLGGTGPALNTGYQMQMAPLLRQGAQITPDIQGDERLALFKPEFKAAIQSYINGDSLPVGKGDKYTQMIKREAEAYGAAMGIPVSDTAIAGRRKLITGLKSGEAGSLGGQINAGITAMGHLADLNEHGKALNNWGTPGILGAIPGLPSVAAGINALGNAKGDYSGLARTMARIAGLYSGEVTKLYAGNRGTGEERHAGSEAFNPNLMPNERETLVRGEVQLSHSKTAALLSQAERELGYSHPEVVKLREAMNAAYDKVARSLAGTSTSGSRPPLGSLLTIR